MELRKYDLTAMFGLMLGVMTSLASASDWNTRSEFRRSDVIVFPIDAPYSPQKASLGKMLFFEPRMSGAQNMSCSTCHNPSFGWEVPIAQAIGGLNQPLERHAPTIENLAEASALLWDGQKASFEEQAIGPITSPKEMNADFDEVVARLNSIASYQNLFDIAFPGEGLTKDTILSALATYERTLRSEWAPFDDWIEGDESAISAAAKRGFDLFVGDGKCSMCHQGWAFTDHSFHAIGLSDEDIGRGIVEPSAPYAFKTPGLRNIALRAPYMHNGEIATLRDVIVHYNQGGVFNPERPSDIVALRLTNSDVSDLLEFLGTLTAYDPHVSAPALPAE